MEPIRNHAFGASDLESAGTHSWNLPKWNLRITGNPRATFNRFLLLGTSRAVFGWPRFTEVLAQIAWLLARPIVWRRTGALGHHAQSWTLLTPFLS